MAETKETPEDFKGPKAFLSAFGWPYLLKVLLFFVISSIASAVIKFGPEYDGLVMNMLAGLIAAQGIIFALLSSHSSEVFKVADQCLQIVNNGSGDRTSRDYKTLLIGGFHFQVVAWLALIALVIAGVTIAADAPTLLKRVFFAISLGLFGLGIWSCFSFSLLNFKIAYRAADARSSVDKKK